MKRLILPIIFILTVLVFFHSKADAQSLGGQDCTYENYYKESYKCLGVFNECQKVCSEKAKGSYLDEVTPADKYSACMKSNDCHGKSKACEDQTWADYQACKNASKSNQSPPKEEPESTLREFSPDILEKTPVTIGEWFDLVSLGITLKDFFSGMAVFSDYVMFEGERQEIREEEAMKEAVAQRRLEKPEFFPATGKEEFISVTYLDKPDVVNPPINAPDRDDIKVYPWGGGNGVTIQSNDWENIKFREPVEVDGITSHVLELEQGAVEVKVKNDNPSENKFGVDAGWLGVTVSRTHFWVSKDEDKKSAIVVVYEGEVEVRTKDGKTVKVSPENGKPGILVVSQKLSPIKLALVGLSLAVVVGSAILIVRRKFSSKGFAKKKK